MGGQLDSLDKLKKDIYFRLFEPISSITNGSTLYIRGSFLDADAIYLPWDIDLTLIIQEDTPYIKQYLEKVTSGLSFKHLGHVYSLDFTYTTLERLECTQTILNIMLHQQSSLVWGENIISKQTIIYPNDKKVNELKIFLKAIIIERLSILENKLKTNIDSQELYLRLRHIIKHLIRWHCLDSLLQKKLIRRLDVCLEWIELNVSYRHAFECKTILNRIACKNIKNSDMSQCLYIIKKHLMMDER